MADLKDSFTTFDGTGSTAYGVKWRYQTFTTTSAYAISDVALNCWKYGSPGNITVSIRAVDDGTGKPIDEDLCSVTVADSEISTLPSLAYYTFTFDSSSPLTDATKYAIVWRATSGDAGNYFQAFGYDSGGYADGGYGTSSDGGSSWSSASATRDMNFRTYGTALINVRSVHLGSDGGFLVAAAETGVFLSTDLGDNWSRKTPDAVEDTDWVKGICSDDGSYIIVVSSANAIYRSANSGTAWGAITPAGGDTFSVNDLATSDDGQFMVIVGQNTTDATESCYISTDYGATWTAKKPVAASIEWTECDISNNGAIIAVSTSSYFYVSFDSGVTWEEQGMASSAEVWEGLSISGDGTTGLVANTNDNNEFFIGINTELYSEATWAEAALTSAGRALLDDANAAAQATTLGLGTGDSPTFNHINITNEVNGYQIDGSTFISIGGTENTFIGIGTRNGDIGSHNFFSGYHAGYNNNTDDVTVGRDGTSNVYIGAKAGAGEVLLTGTVAITNGSDAVVGTGTAFTTELVVGDVIRIYEVEDACEISVITDDTHLTLASNYTGTTHSFGIIYRERGANNGNENIAIGHLALSLNSTGYENTAVGDNALKMNTTGYGNTALGNDAMQGANGVLITGNYNTALGVDALYIISSGSYNTAVGYQALYSNTTGQYNVAMGYQALYSNIDTNYNVAIGFKALQGAQAERNVAIGYEAGFEVAAGTGDQGRFNIYVGYKSGYGNTTDTVNQGYRNIGLGAFALFYNTTGYENVAIGETSCDRNTEGYKNLAIGGDTLYHNITGIYNVAIGWNAGRGAETYSHNYNTFIGAQSGENIRTGQHNTAIGKNSGGLLTTGSSNIYIGKYAGYRQTTLSDRLIIDNQVRADVATELTNAILYGVMAATPAAQSLRINAQTEVRGLVIQAIAKTGAYTLIAIDDFVECDASGGAFTITLPAVASTTIGKVYHIKKTDNSANAITIDGNASETIDGGITARITTQYECITIINNGSEWWII